MADGQYRQCPHCRVWSNGTLGSFAAHVRVCPHQPVELHPDLSSDDDEPPSLPHVPQAIAYGCSPGDSLRNNHATQEADAHVAPDEHVGDDHHGILNSNPRRSVRNQNENERLMRLAVKEKEASQPFGVEMSGLDTDGEGWGDDDEDDPDPGVRNFFGISSTATSTAQHPPIGGATGVRPAALNSYISPGTDYFPDYEHVNPPLGRKPPPDTPLVEVDSDAGTDRAISHVVVPNTEGGAVQLWNATTSHTPFSFPVTDPAFTPVTTRSRRTMMKLHRCVEEAGCPRYFFDRFMAILKEEVQDNGFNVLTDVMSRASFQKYFTKNYKCAPPIVHDVPLEVGVDALNPTETYKRGLRDVAQVIVFSFQEQLDDLLNDRLLFGDIKNLVVNKESEHHFRPYTGNSSTLDEVLDGSWYQETVQVSLKIDPKDGTESRDFWLPIIIYVDKTGTDANQRHSLEPVLFTLGIFKREIRNQARAWRILGFVPDLELKSSAVKTVARSKMANKGVGTRNYHACLRVVLDSLIKAQKQPPPAYLRIGQRVKAVRCRVPLAFVIGDGKSGDMLCGRFGGYKTTRMCRACCVSYADSNNPAHTCKWVAAKVLQEFSEKASEHVEPLLDRVFEALSPSAKKKRKSELSRLRKQRRLYTKLLHSYSQHRHLSAFTEVDFGANELGICGATPSDLMHAFLEGVMKYAIRIFIDPLSPIAKKDLDFLIDEIFGRLRNSEQANFLRSNFTHGYTNLTMLTADEWAGMAMTLLVVNRFQRGRDILEARFCNDDDQGPDPIFEDHMPSPATDLGDSFLAEKASPPREQAQAEPEEEPETEAEADDALDLDEEVDPQEEYELEESRFRRHMEEIKQGSKSCITEWGLVELLERVLAFHAFYKRGGPYTWEDPKKAESLIRLKVREMLGMISVRLPRETGNAWRLQKFHEMLHLASDMSRFGSPQNYDAGPGESSLRVWAKKPAMTSQKKGAVRFAGQVATRLYESACFQKMERSEAEPTALAATETPMWPDSIEDEGVSPDHYDDDISRDSDNEPVPNPDLPDVSSQLTGKPKFEVSIGVATGSAGSAWLGKRKQKRLVELHPVVLQYLQNLIEDSTNATQRISGYTEYKRDGVLFRAHPNYQSTGMWYDWVMISWTQEDNDATVEPSCLRRAKKPKIQEDHLTFPYQSPYVSKSSTTTFIPAKIIAFVTIDNDPDNIFALVHSCNTKSADDFRQDTRLTEEWTLEYQKEPTSRPFSLQPDGHSGPNKNTLKHVVQPSLCLVNVDTFGERVLVFEEQPGITESLELHRKSALRKELPSPTAKYFYKQTPTSKPKWYWSTPSPKVVLVRDRDKYWAEHFLAWNTNITRRYKVPAP